MSLPNSVQQAIATHRQAVMSDEASFTDAGIPIDDDLAERTGAAELEAFITLAKTPCASDADVQAKLDYVLHGSVGERTTMLGCLGLDEYGGEEVHAAFLRSLVVLESGR